MRAGTPTAIRLIPIGLAAGIVSGVLEVGGGIVMVPLLTAGVGVGQHEAHETGIAPGLDADILQVLSTLFLLLSGTRTLIGGLAARRTEWAEAS